MPKPTSIGILGAGQLAAYLCQASRQLGLQTTVLAESPTDPAVAVADNAIIAPLSSLTATRELLLASDVVTFEREDIDSEVLQLLSNCALREAGGVFPHPDVVALLQDKAKQKQWLLNNGLPTARFMLCSGDEAFADIIRLCGSPFIQKACKGGFDGRGVQQLTALDEHRLWPGASIVEEAVNYEREISVLVARSRQGEMKCYPVVDTNADPSAHQLDLASSPSTLNGKVRTRAEQLGRNIVARLDGVGVFAIEMFVTRKQNLLVNEISPRVHNTGHLTIEANQTSQFEQHVRAICGFELGSTEQRIPAAMKNIVQQDNMPAANMKGFVREQVASDLFVHWYGKEEPRLRRKMGHLTVLAPTVDEARTHAELKHAELTQPQECVA